MTPAEHSHQLQPAVQHVASLRARIQELAHQLHLERQRRERAEVALQRYRVNPPEETAGDVVSAPAMTQEE